MYRLFKRYKNLHRFCDGIYHRHRRSMNGRSRFADLFNSMTTTWTWPTLLLTLAISSFHFPLCPPRVFLTLTSLSLSLSLSVPFVNRPQPTLVPLCLLHQSAFTAPSLACNVGKMLDLRAQPLLHLGTYSVSSMLGFASFSDTCSGALRLRSAPWAQRHRIKCLHL